MKLKVVCNKSITHLPGCVSFQTLSIIYFVSHSRTKQVTLQLMYSKTTQVGGISESSLMRENMEGLYLCDCQGD